MILEKKKKKNPFFKCYNVRYRKKKKSKIKFNTTTNNMKSDPYTYTFIPGEESKIRSLGLNNRYLQGKNGS